MNQTRQAARATTGRDLYQEVTDKLIAAIERDPGKPQMPWRRAGAPLWMPVNALTENEYRGINVVTLWCVAEEKGYTHPIFATYKQWQELGAQVRKGEKSALVIKYGEYEVEPDADREDDDGKRVYAKAAYVFNCAQVDGFTPPDQPPPLGPIERIEHAVQFVANTGAKVVIGGDRAFYRPSSDTVHMPDEGLFTGTDTMSRSENWHAVELHEIGHWSSHASRCNRELGKRFEDKAYCAEELVEIIAATLCAELGITQDVRPDHAQYLAQWLELMKSDSRAIFTAAAKAGQAVDYLRSLQPPEPDPHPEPEERPDGTRGWPEISERDEVGAPSPSRGAVSAAEGSPPEFTAKRPAHQPPARLSPKNCHGNK